MAPPTSHYSSYQNAKIVGRFEYLLLYHGPSPTPRRLLFGGGPLLCSSACGKAEPTTTEVPRTQRTLNPGHTSRHPMMVSDLERLSLPLFVDILYINSKQLVPGFILFTTTTWYYECTRYQVRNEHTRQHEHYHRCHDH